MATCSDFPSDATLWIKKVEMVDSLDESKNSRSVCWKEFSKLRDVRREDCLCSEQRSFRIPSSIRRSVWRNKKAQKEDHFLRGRQIAYLIYDYFRVTAANDSVENYADLFTIVLRNDDIQEFDSKWDGTLL